MAQTPRVYARDVGGIGPHIRRFPYLAEVILPAAAFGTIGRLSAQAGAVERSRASGLDRFARLNAELTSPPAAFRNPLQLPQQFARAFLFSTAEIRSSVA